MRLWNAHRRVFYKKPIPYLHLLALEKSPNGWRKILTEDVVKFVDDLEEKNLAGSQDEQRHRIMLMLQDTPRFFSRPKNVPIELRKQIYLYDSHLAFHLSIIANHQSVRPDFVITLIRTPHLAPKYASFWVPLWFNKLDFKGYLKNVYNVDVLHIRSYVQQAKIDRDNRRDSNGQVRTEGRLFRPSARKKMTVELVDPFVYPEEGKDLSPYVYQAGLSLCVAIAD